ncbi:MAG: DUF424 family protein [Candidatus Heimdallarchaeota archaeon]|nr:DUF424 family protein [Candidatus Heimdallarchaeota archaeon]
MKKKNKEPMFYLRVRQTEKEYLVAACDEKILGETLIEGDLELYVNERFFGGELVSLDKCLEELNRATSCNIIGFEIVNAAIENRLVSDLAVMWIDCPKNGRVGHVMRIR